MAKENIKVITPDTKTKALTSYSFPIEGVVIEAETLEEAKEILKKLSDNKNNN